MTFEEQDDHHGNQWRILCFGSIEFLQHLSGTPFRFVEDSDTRNRMKAWGARLFGVAQRETKAAIIAVL
eukprot:2575946-Pleurochrysis_carterae.AAC.1